MNSIIKGTIKGLADIGTEAGKEIVKETGKIAESIITGKELLGNIKEASREEEYQEKQKQEQELDSLRKQMGQGRDVDREIGQIVDQKKQIEEEKERLFLENLQKQREAERAEMASMESEMVSSNPAKRKKKRGSALMPGKKSQPEADQMSATSEFKGKVD